MRQSGATAVEFALVLPVFVGVLFGAIDGARLV
ncbi:MAG TPA: TadE/TadG family type IV pilus assembly protein, partial [Polyangia bacterium]|nr:TadE/TadG family type IV pilus assembly protein [Polyangia bacterium]